MMLFIDSKVSLLSPGRTLTVDTGMNTGWACWEKTDSIYLSSWGELRAKGKTAEDRLESLSGKWVELISRYSPDAVFLEGQQFWAGNAVSYASASSTDLFKLSYITGIYFAGAIGKARVKIITPTEWKGQLTKTATLKRVQRAFSKYELVAKNMEKESEHVIDAVGMGLSLSGVL